MQIPSYQIFGVVGESGSGKSTLLRLINALEKPDSGSVWLDGQIVHQLSETQQTQVRKKTGMIFQQFNLLNNLSVFENVQLPLKLNGIKRPEKVLEALGFVGLSAKAGQFPRQLSGGQKQRVGIARALVTQPAILLCDEPTSALDMQATNEIIRLLKQINHQFQTTIVIVSHELELVNYLCDQAAVIENGELLDVLKITQKPIPTHTSYYQRIKEVLGNGEL